MHGFVVDKHDLYASATAKRNVNGKRLKVFRDASLAVQNWRDNVRVCVCVYFVVVHFGRFLALIALICC